jgi:PQQ-dependent catabolism-associated CXXCW motif protein
VKRCNFSFAIRYSLFAFLSLTSPASADVDEPEGYRLDNFRSEVPATLKGATVVTTAEAERLWRSKAAVFVDVLPKPPKPANLPAGTIWQEPLRQDIPGSIWLPNVGLGALPPALEIRFSEALSKATGGDKARAILFYCLERCWMSWNAAKRALALGYLKVLWYPEGTDGWSRQGLPLERRTPVDHRPASQD